MLRGASVAFASASTHRDRPQGSWVEGNYELFEGHMLFWRFYMCWLVSVGLAQVADHAHATALEARLTDEGRSVMRMLQATRDPDWAELPMSEVLDAVRASGRGTASAAREAALVSFEAEAAHLPWVHVTAYGTIDGCDVSASSGFADLDETTCRLLMRRSRYSPARDANGAATDAFVTKSVDWTIPQQ